MLIYTLCTRVRACVLVCVNAHQNTHKKRSKIERYSNHMVLLVPGNKISVVLETVATEGEVMSNCDNQEGREFDLTSTGKEASGERDEGGLKHIYIALVNTPLYLYTSPCSVSHPQTRC